MKNKIIILCCTYMILLFTFLGCGDASKKDGVSSEETVSAFADKTVSDTISSYDEETGDSELIIGITDTTEEDDFEREISVSELTEEEKYLEIAFEAIEDIVESDVKNGFTSAQIAVMKDNRLIYVNSWGLTNSYTIDGERIGNGTEVNDYTLYDLASNTKMYSVIYAVQFLVTKGEIDIDEKIVDILGEDFADKVIEDTYVEGTHSDSDTQRLWKRSISVKDVLCHRAGFPDSIHYYDPQFDVAELKSIEGIVNPLYQGDNASREDVLEQIKRTPLQYKPGGKAVYSDIDYILMTFVLEKITGMPLDEFVRTTFYEPMGLKHITYKPLENGFSADNIAATELHGNTRDGVVDFPGVRKYTLQGEVHDECAFYSMNGVSGHAGLFANAVDLALLCNTMIDGTYNGKVYFESEVLDDFCAAYSDSEDGWGIGWWRHGESGAREYYFSTDSSYNTVGHQGWTGTLTMIDRENKLVLVLLTNRINSPVTDTSIDSNMFDAKWYTSANLYFAAPIIYSALFADDENYARRNISELMDDFVRDREIKASGISGENNKKHPAVLAYEASLEAKEHFIKRKGD